MPEGTYTMLKPTKGVPRFTEHNTGAHYYAYGAENSVSRYKKASATIILPNRLRVIGTNNSRRNAYIALGVAVVDGIGVDIGLCNRGLDIGSNQTESGWYPCCYEVGQDVGYYYDGEHGLGSYFAPSTAKRAKVEIEPNINGRSIRFSVTWLDANDQPVGTAFNKVITLSRTYQWTAFYRFASLVPRPSTTLNNDSTYMLGGEFLNAKLGAANWGISTGQVVNAWIMHHPKCQLPDGYWDTGEQFRIDHWA